MFYAVPFVSRKVGGYIFPEFFVIISRTSLQLMLIYFGYKSSIICNHSADVTLHTVRKYYFVYFTKRAPNRNSISSL
jgi:hypothetical protein